MKRERARGRLVTVEGIEGVGKSTNIGFVADFLRRAGYTVIVTREPGGTDTAEKIRAVLLDSEPGSLPADAELLLMFAARACHLETLIRPALARGEWVVCDRFTDASHAYQAGGRGLPAAAVDWLEAFVQRGLVPDLTLLLDASPGAVAARRRQRGGSDRFETEDTAFFERVRTEYLAIAGRDRDRVRLINADLELEEVRRQIAGALQDYIDKLD